MREDGSEIPWRHVYGQPTETELRVEQFDMWARARALRCKHETLDSLCRMCRGTLVVSEAFGTSGVVRLIPML